jgi:hypothetical protein
MTDAGTRISIEAEASKQALPLVTRCAGLIWGNVSGQQ